MPDASVIGWGLAALLAAVICGVTLRRPLLGLSLVAAVFPFDVPLVHESPWTIYAGEVMLVGLFAGLALARGPVPGLRFDSPVARGALAALGCIWVATAVGALGAADRWAAAKQGLRWAELWGLLAAASVLVRSRRDAGVVFGAYALMAVALSALGIAEVLAGPGAWINAGSQVLDENQAVIRAHGPFSPNAFAPYLGLGLLILTAAGTLWPNLPPVRPRLLALPLAVALVLTQSRIGWAAAAAGLAVVAVLRPVDAGPGAAARFRPRWRLLLTGAAAAVVLIAILAAAFPGVAGRLHSLRHPWQDGNFSFRVRIFRWAGAQWTHRPLTGYGAGSYPRVIYRTPDPIPADLLPAAAAHAHNLFVQLALETGLLGLGAWLAALGWLGLTLRRAWSRDRALGAVGLGLFASFLVNNMLEDTLIHSRGILYAIGWGVVLGAAGREPVAKRRDKLGAMLSFRALRRRLPGGTLTRDLVLFGLFTAIVAWSLFFSLPRPGATAAAVAPGQFHGVVVVRVRDLSPGAWPAVRPGDAMTGVAEVTKTEVVEGVVRDLLVTLEVTGPIEYLNLRWPFPPKEGPLKIGSVVSFETGRYRFMGEVIRTSP